MKYAIWSRLLLCVMIEDDKPPIFGSLRWYNVFQKLELWAPVGAHTLCNGFVDLRLYEHQNRALLGRCHREDTTITR